MPRSNKLQEGPKHKMYGHFMRKRRTNTPKSMSKSRTFCPNGVQNLSKIREKSRLRRGCVVGAVSGPFLVPDPDLDGPSLATIFDNKSEKGDPTRHTKNDAKKVLKNHAKNMLK